MALRPAGKRLLADAGRGLFDEVWVWKIDRLGRDDVDPLVVWRDLELLGIKVHSVTEGNSDPFMYHIHVAVAAQERRNFMARSATGMNRAAREGRYTGGIVPLGYLVEGRKQHARPGAQRQAHLGGLDRGGAGTENLPLAGYLKAGHALESPSTSISWGFPPPTPKMTGWSEGDNARSGLKVCGVPVESAIW